MGNYLKMTDKRRVLALLGDDGWHDGEEHRPARVGQDDGVWVVADQHATLVIEDGIGQHRGQHSAETAKRVGTPAEAALNGRLSGRMGAAERLGGGEAAGCGGHGSIPFGGSADGFALIKASNNDRQSRHTVDRTLILPAMAKRIGPKAGHTAPFGNPEHEISTLKQVGAVCPSATDCSGSEEARGGAPGELDGAVVSSHTAPTDGDNQATRLTAAIHLTPWGRSKLPVG
jgi:hypothetical protein